MTYFDRFKVPQSKIDNEAVCRTSGFKESARNRIRSEVMNREAGAVKVVDRKKKELQKLLKKKIAIYIEGHLLYRTYHVFNHMLNNLTRMVAWRYVSKGYIPRPIYSYTHNNHTYRYYSEFQIKAINRIFRKNEKAPLEVRGEKLHERFKQDPLLKIYNER